MQVYAENDITNTMQARTFGAISLGSAGNMQGTYLFLSLTSWKIIRRRSWVEMPLPAEVIELINAQALKTNKASLESSIGIGDVTISDEDIDEYEPYIPEQVVIDIQKNRYNGAEDLVQSENHINDTVDINVDIDSNNLPSVQSGYDDDIQKMVIDSMEIMDEIYEPNDNEQEIINQDIQYKNEGNINKTHRYHLRPTRSDWKNRYAGEYSAPVVLSNLSIPKAIRL